MRGDWANHAANRSRSAGSMLIRLLTCFTSSGMVSTNINTVATDSTVKTMAIPSPLGRPRCSSHATAGASVPTIISAPTSTRTTGSRRRKIHRPAKTSTRENIVHGAISMRIERVRRDCTSCSGSMRSVDIFFIFYIAISNNACSDVVLIAGIVLSVIFMRADIYTIVNGQKLLCLLAYTAAAYLEDVIEQLYMERNRRYPEYLSFQSLSALHPL